MKKVTETKKQILPEPDDKAFTVPEGYFLSLPEKIAARVRTRQAPVPDTRKLSPWFYAAAAAVVVVLLTLGLFLSKEGQQSEKQQFTQSLPVNRNDSNRLSAAVKPKPAAPVQEATNTLPRPEQQAATSVPVKPQSVNDQSDNMGQGLDDITDEAIIEYLLETDIDLIDLSY